MPGIDRGNVRSLLVWSAIGVGLLSGCDRSETSVAVGSGSPASPASTSVDVSVAALVEEIRQGLATNPDDGARWRLLGETCYVHGLLDEARSSAERAVELLPDSDRTRFLLGAIHAKRGDFTAATKAGLEAIDRSQSPGGLDWQVGAWAMEGGDYGLARRLAEGAVASAPTDPEPRWLLARIEIDEGRAKEAVAVLEPLLAADPQDGATRFLMGRAMRATGRDRDADDQAVLAGADRPEFVSPRIRDMMSRRVDRNARLSRAASVAARGDFDEARRIAAETRAIYGDEREVVFSDVVIASLAHDHRRVMDLTDAMLVDHANWSPIWIRRGLAAAALPAEADGPDPVQVALDAGRRAIELAPADPQAHEIIGRASARGDDWASALVAFQEAHRLDPSEPRYRLAVGDCLVETGSPLEGIKWVNEMDRLYGLSVDSALVRVRAMIDLGRLEEAQALLEQCRRAIPNHPQIPRTERRFERGGG